MKDKKGVKVTYCTYCKRQTEHEVVDLTTNREGTGEKLLCTRCGSARIGMIQGFDASLM